MNSQHILTFKQYPQFKPNISPREMLQRGIFGGTYFRQIYCTVTNKTYCNQHLEFSDFKGIPTNKISTSIYDVTVNYFGVACGTSLEYWQSKNWIRACDPYGWFQWYCRFYYGRRHEDDIRQIKRWQRQVRRFLNLPDVKRTNKIRQVLLHWAVFVEPQ